MSKEESRGRVGLQNGGNTCFMNAALQCLLHSPELVFPFLDTNDNPIEGQTNNKYKMVREFAKLARTHYSTKSKFQSPQDFRKALKNIASYLCDGDQHDSHELMNFVLQGLEEELNKHKGGEVRIENNYVPVYSNDDPSSEEYISEELAEKAKEWWSDYKSLNDCFITDVLYGEICNQIQCTKCKKCVYNYSSFNTLYVPVKKSTVNITVNLIFQYYDPEEDFINLSYFTVPLSLKGSDMVKMIDIKLRELLQFSFDSFVDVEEPDLAEFAKQSRFVYLLKKQHPSKGITYSKLPLNHPVSEFATAKSSSILVYFVPPIQPSSTPVFLYISPLRCIRSNGQQSENPINNYSFQTTSPCVPLLFSFPKAMSISAIQAHMCKVISLAKQGRISCNLKDRHPSSQYNTLYSPISINAYYFTRSIFFYQEEVVQSVDDSVAEEVVEEVIEGVKEEKEEEQEQGKEEVKEEMKEETTENPTSEQPQDEKPTITIPRYYISSFTTFSSVIQSIQSITDIKDLNENDTVASTWTNLDTNIDYRVLLCCTSFMNCSAVRTAFSFEKQHNKEKVFSSISNCTCCEFEMINYRDEDDIKPAAVSWGKKKSIEKPSSQQLNLVDCIELKKTTTVMLTGSSTCQHCHDSKTLETTPYLCRLPPILMIQLKRFKYAMSSVGRSRQSFGRQKIDAYVDFPVKDLDVSEYLLDSVKEQIDNPAKMHYKLLGVVNHSGTADFGHYYAYCRDGYNDNDNWFEYNDASVSPVREEEVVTKNAYVLIYRRSDLTNAIYSTISTMNIVTGKGKKEENSQPKEDISELVLQRDRSNGIEKESKQGKDNNQPILFPEEKQTKKRMSKHERQQLKKELKNKHK